MLLAGDLDAVLSARPPRGMGKGIRRLFSDYESAEVLLQDGLTLPRSPETASRRAISDKLPFGIKIAI